MRPVSRRRLLRGGLALAGAGLLAGCEPAPRPGGQSRAGHRIGFLDSGAGVRRLEPFREEMRELGYVEGQNLTLELRSAGARLERQPELLAELAALGVELIVVTTPANLREHLAGSAIPLVMIGGDVIASGYVTNLAHPGGRITGVSSNTAEYAGKWVELLRDAVPGLVRLAAVADPGVNTPAFRQAVRRAAEALRLDLRLYDLDDVGRAAEVLAAAKADRAEGLVVMTGGALGAGADPRFAQEALRQRLPAVTQAREFAVNGGLLAFGPDDRLIARRGASFVDKILRGANPGDLPVELPTNYTFVVNLQTARALGLTLPDSVLAQATEVIQ